MFFDIKESNNKVEVCNYLSWFNWNGIRCFWFRRIDIPSEKVVW